MRRALILAAVLLVSACGFHLRGQESVTLAPSLSPLRVTMADRMAYPPLLVEMRNALYAQAHVQLAALDQPVPQLSLFGEFFEAQVLTIDARGNVSGYLLNYKVSFSLRDAGGKPLVADQTVKLQREYDFDPLNVLAKEREEGYLRAEMQREAVQQILRRLAAVKLDI